MLKKVNTTKLGESIFRRRTYSLRHQSGKQKTHKDWNQNEISKLIDAEI